MTAFVWAQVAELILTGWPAEGSQLLQPLLVRMLATVLEGSEPVLVITGASSPHLTPPPPHSLLCAVTWLPGYSHLVIAALKTAVPTESATAD